MCISVHSLLQFRHISCDQEFAETCLAVSSKEVLKTKKILINLCEAIPPSPKPNPWENIISRFQGTQSVCKSLLFDTVFVSYNVCSMYESARSRAVGLAPFGRRNLLEEEMIKFNVFAQEQVLKQ